MEVTALWTATSFIVEDAPPSPPPPPCEMPPWPCNPDGTGAGTTFTANTSSQPYIALAHLALDRQEYLDSLITPSSDEIIRIAGVQAIKEAKNKRRDRIHRRVTSEASLQRYRQDVYLQIPDEHSGHHSKESLANKSHSRNSSISIFSHAGVINTSCPSTASRSRSASVGDDSTQYSRPVSLIPRHSHTHHGQNEQKPMDASTRWTQALHEARFRDLTAPRSRIGLTQEIIQSLPPGSVFEDGSDGLGLGLSLLGTSNRAAVARQRWKKAIAVACRAGFDCHGGDDSPEDDYQSELDYMSSDSDSDDNGDEKEKQMAREKREAARARCREEAKVINELYLLELVDHKHRYGLNLFVYHEEWLRAETRENFFYWLDYGEGRFLDLETCPREKLDREQIRYLSHEEQQLYLVVVGSGGRLRWAKNGLPVDTSDKWRDSIQGIVPVNDPTPSFTPAYLLERGISFGGGSSTNDSSRAASSWSTSSTYATSLSSTSAQNDNEEQAEKEQLSGPSNSVIPLDIHHHSTTTTISAPPPPPPPLRKKTTSKQIKKMKYGGSHASWLIDKFLKQNWGPTPWIFVADSSSRLYIGIKETGTFQHTSFVRGSRVSAAGMISVREGVVQGLSPLSGHYRPSTGSFRKFVKGLRAEGVATAGGGNGSLGELEFLGRDYLLLRGFEIYSRVRKGLWGWGVGGLGMLGVGSENEDGGGGEGAGEENRRRRKKKAGDKGRAMVKSRHSWIGGGGGGGGKKKGADDKSDTQPKATEEDGQQETKTRSDIGVTTSIAIGGANSISNKSKYEIGTITGKGKGLSGAAQKKMVLRKLHRITSMPITTISVLEEEGKGKVAPGRAVAVPDTTHDK